MSHSAHTFLVGVDGGGTGCRTAVGTLADGVLAQAQGGRANAATDPDMAIRNILIAVNAAAKKAGIPKSALKNAVAHLGLAGVMTQKDAQRIAMALPFEKSLVTDDRPTAVNGALGGEDGYLLSVGTGTISAANRSGTFSYIGGWGFHVADQGSGAWLGRASLEQTLLCHDGLAEHTELTRTLFARFEDDPNAIVAFSMSAKPGDYGALAPMIVSAANNGDPWGSAIMRKGADYLTRCLDALGFRPGDRMCLSGGVGPHYAAYLPDECLTGRVASKGTALDGAFSLARAAATSLQEDA
ncbi:BadF/BadG/BcrA/BcrD ATPase family protein [uncultured Roseobacter sp.]|uniref:BadF/BadG/BcrA/BcrD ATPase family protein n=1 Tax=uncultured Roseobacter sp. TaxID=114847 RepID=UPI0026082AE5|nr:BadF/BadG/BcrA/BcrD ATPase family protein [uncultured Roseobacter sp.]